METQLAQLVQHQPGWTNSQTCTPDDAYTHRAVQFTIGDRISALAWRQLAPAVHHAETGVE